MICNPHEKGSQKKKKICVSREVLDLSLRRIAKSWAPLLGPSPGSTQPLIQFGPADAFARRRRGSKPSRRRPVRARGGPQGCTECRRFPLRGKTSIHHRHSARVSGSPAPLRVVRSPVAFLVTTLRWQPVRCAAGLVFCGAQYLGKAASQCRQEDLRTAPDVS